MKIIRHYLSVAHDQVRCPLNRDSACNNTCAWFDNEAADCRLMLYIGDLSRVFAND